MEHVPVSNGGRALHFSGVRVAITWPRYTWHMCSMRSRGSGRPTSPPWISLPALCGLGYVDRPDISWLWRPGTGHASVWKTQCGSVKTMELIELIAAYLGLPILRHGRPVQLYNMYMRRVGVIHHAKFMAKAITLLKMALLHDKHQDNFTAAEWTQVNRLAEFVALIYGRYFLQSALSSAAPRIDIGFMGDVLSYRPINNVISTSAKESFLNHLLYPCPELVVLAFFDTDVPNHEKYAMARTLVAHQVPL